jgi:diguanylate cyclase (GGDEF)-like protein
MLLRAGWSSFHFLIAVAVGLTCAAAIAIALTIWWLRNEAIRDAYVNTGNLATVLAEQTSRSVQSIDLMLDELYEWIDSIGARTPSDFHRLLEDEDTYKLLMERMTRLSHITQIALVDKDGWILNSTNRWPLPPTSLFDREHFQHVKNNDDYTTYISEPIVGRLSGIPTILFNRRINDTKGAFLGMLVIGVRLSYFQHIYESLTSLYGLSFLFTHKDGAIILRYPDSNDRAIAKIPAGSPWYHLVLQGGGHYRSPDYFDGQAHLVAVHPLRDYPLVVNVAETEVAALAPWRLQAITIGTGTLLVIFCLVLLLITLNKQFRRLATSEATLIEKAVELKHANGTIDAALNNMSQGLVMFDSSSRLVVCNHRYFEMYGLSPEIVRPGCTLRELLNHRIAAGHFLADDPEQYLTEILAAVKQRITFSKLTSLPDGRIISVVNHPVADGGWVATHEDVTDAKRSEERISYAAHHDLLTGLPNRKLFSEQLEQALKRARRGEPLAVLYLDVDHLKRINDTLGHSIGDKLLKGVADRLRGCIRDVDVVARLSGDEFAIIQTSLDRPSDAADLAMRAREAIHEPFDLNNHHVTVDISIGISIAPNDATELNDLLKTADIALYEAKNSGRGTYRFYEPEMNARMQARDKLERDLQSALANGEFELFYQPVVSLEVNKIRSFEALLRWHHPTRGLVAPTEFIPIAEETGLIVPLGEWVLRQACAEAANWPHDIGIAVNISPIQLTNKNLANAVIGAIASAGIPADRLILEITESIFLQNTSANLATLKRLHELGVQFAMDDFGTGYSSLGYLMSFPFSKIKIDRSFITDLPTKKESRAIIRAIIDLARSLKIKVIAEGVETAQQLEQLRRLGCTDTGLSV